MHNYLELTQLRELITAAVNSGVPTQNRSILLNGISSPFVLGLPINSAPLNQFILDLQKFNEVERLASGQVPLAIYLDNIAFQLELEQRQEAKVFRRFANEIRNRASGVTNLPAPAALPEMVRNEAIVGVNEMVSFAFLANGARAGRSVARLSVPRFESGAAIQTNDGKPWIMFGTGWLVGPKLLLTNQHVVNARRSEEPKATAADLDRQARETLVELDFEDGLAPVQAGVAKLLASDDALDYALLELSTDHGRAPLICVKSALLHTAASYQSVNIVQHPNGQSKKAAIRSNLVSGADANVVRYFTDTDFGSSGSPVCNDNWIVVALHRGAKFASGVSYQGKSTAYVNFGSQISAVLDDIQLRAPASHALIS